MKAQLKILINKITKHRQYMYMVCITQRHYTLNKDPSLPDQRPGRSPRCIPGFYHLLRLNPIQSKIKLKIEIHYLVPLQEISENLLISI